MKNIFTTLLAVVLTMGMLSTSFAADVKENVPRRRDVEKVLEEIGDDHNPEKMKITEVGSVETESTWFHIFSGYLRETYNYRIIIFDNTPRYLGYYEIPSPFKADDVGEGEIVVLNEDSSEESFIKLTDNGPARGINLGGGVTAQFVKGPEPEEPEAAEDGAENADGTALPGEGQAEPTAGADDEEEEQEPAESKKLSPEYRSWTISRGGQSITFDAIFVELKDKRTIVVKSAKNGNTADILIAELSANDKKYLQELMQ